MARRVDETVRIGADTKAAERGLKGFVGRSKLLLVGLAAAAAAGVAAMGAKMLKVFAAQEQADLRLRRSLQATGRYSAEEEQRLQRLADSVQEFSTVGDEAAQQIIGQLVQVGQVAGDQIEDALFATVGLAKQQGRSVERTARTVSASLADIADENKNSLGELEKFFTSAEREKLKAMKATEGGMAAQAEAIRILNERYREHGRAVEGSTDIYAQTQNALGDVMEGFGRLFHMIAGSTVMRDFFSSMAGWLDDLYVRVNTQTAQWELQFAVLELAYLRMLARIGLADQAEVDAARQRRIDAMAALIEAAREVEEGMIPGGAPGGPLPDDPIGGSDPDGDAREEERRAREAERIADEELHALQRVSILQSTLQGLEDAELAYQTRAFELQREHTEAMRLLEEESTRALGELRLEEVALKRLLNEEALADAREAAREEVAATEWYADERVGKIRGMFDDLASISQDGSKKLSKISKLAARAQLLIDLATKPFEAFAKTSAQYPWPLGPALGALHAGITAAKIGAGLSAVGGGGGGSSASSGSAPSVSAGAEAPDVGRREQRQVFHVSVELDGQTVAQVVQERIAQAEDE